MECILCNAELYHHGDLYLLLGRDDALSGLEAGNSPLRIVDVFPIVVNWKVSIVHKLERLRLVLALVCRYQLADTGVDASKLHAFAVQVNSRGLHLSEELEVERLGISDEDLEVLFDGLLVDTVGRQEDLLPFHGLQGVMRGVKVDDVAPSCLDWLAALIQ